MNIVKVEPMEDWLQNRIDMLTLAIELNEADEKEMELWEVERKLDEELLKNIR